MLIAVIALLFTIDISYATGYYVDKTTGDDGDTGLTPDLAWETLAKVNGFSFSAVDTIYFNAGDEWREILTIGASGEDGNEIVYTRYGEGNAVG